MESSSTVTSTMVAQQSPNESRLLILKIREAEKKKIRWTNDTVDNETLGKKSSKRCCIYHKRKEFGESDSEESDSDTEVAKKQEASLNRPKNYLRFHA